MGETVARLQRFYGGEPAAWLDLPGWLLRAFGELLPVLRAEEALEAVSVLAVGTGAARRQDAQAAIRRWHREASRAGGGEDVRTSPEGARNLMAAMGIGVVRHG